MSFIQSMQHRYTTKLYDNTKKINPKKIEELKEILRLSPSSINSQPWKFSFISDKETKNELAKASFFNDKKILNCDTVVVFSRIDSTELFEDQIAETLPQGAVDYYNQVLKPNPDEQIKRWFDKQVYLALGVFLSACAEMEIDSTPMEGIEPEKYNKILGLKGYHTLVAVAIGYRDTEDSNQVDKNPKARIAKNKIIYSI
ncbi:nitroreductase family protein [Flavobacterium arcticum]|uniref:nitroreductase family protein n=1 Tax=Flavobacterium arcticum TaxID=1784713 RepID=UPI0013C2D10D|nr:nitroreductase family protein [Flavobacterium arcticum]